MDTEDIAAWIVMLCFFASLVLSLWNMRRRLPFIDRYFPATLQVFILVVSLTPSFHGHPIELFTPMILTLLWAVCAIASSYRLYHMQVGTFRVLGVAQFVESVGAVLLVLVATLMPVIFIMAISFGILEPNRYVDMP